MRAKLQPVFNMGGLNPRSGKFERQQTGWAHWCPACHTMHAIKFDSGWKLSGGWDAPTFEFSGAGSAIMYGKNPWIETPSNPLCVYKILVGHITYANGTASMKAAEKEFGTMTVPLPLWEIQDLMPKPPRWPLLAVARALLRRLWLRITFKAL